MRENQRQRDAADLAFEPGRAQFYRASRGMSRAAITPNGRVLRHPGDLEWLERRRLQAADLLAQGRTRGEVAGELGVSAQTASRW